MTNIDMLLAMAYAVNMICQLAAAALILLNMYAMQQGVRGIQAMHKVCTRRQSQLQLAYLIRQLDYTLIFRKCGGPSVLLML